MKLAGNQPRASLSADDAATVDRLLEVAKGATDQLRHLALGDLARNALDEVADRLELVAVYAAAETGLAQEAERRTA